MSATTNRCAFAARLAALTVLMASPGLDACGGSGPVSHAAADARSARPGSAARRSDFDNDDDNNDDDAKVLAYGHAADAAQLRVAVAFARRYYATAAAEDGVRACRMLVPVVAEMAAEADGRGPRTCGQALTRLFRLHRTQLSQKSASLRVVAVRTKGARALVVLEFPPLPEARQIEERRLGNTWKMFELFDGIIE